MIQAQTQTPEYWGLKFTLTEKDIEQIYNHFLEVERPQIAAELVKVVIAYRVADELRNVERLLSGRTVYQPQNSYEVGQQLVFPAMQFVHGEVTAVRKGYNPQYGNFNVVTVETNGKLREFATDLQADHVRNADGADLMTQLLNVDTDRLYELYGHKVEKKLLKQLETSSEFVRLGEEWFVKALMLEINIGHLHLAEAILEMSEGGPLPTTEIIPHLDLDADADLSVRRFSLNEALLNDERFDEIAPAGKVAWFLRRMEPDGVKETPERLQYTAVSYDRALLSPQLLTLERELDDEWSELDPVGTADATTLTLTYPHRWAGTLPLSSRTRPLFPASNSPRQRVIFVDEGTGDEIVGWVVQHERYIYGLKDWYEENGLAVGGYIYLRPGTEPGKIMLNYDRRRPQREWVRIATVADNRIKFELMRRSIGCGYDDLLIVGTDVVTAIDALWRRIESQQRSISSLLAELFPQLASLTPQNTVHAKTLYSALNMLKRLPPGPIFAELVRHPAFKPVGDHYWRFESENWRG
ncbi:MAG: hypothetical protein H6662_04015 [Ardenticatenaceae bacterium]|nr:hypothetical protein [Anaerolineales bacterium]MCB8920729.1 hypothetical protein [Ardenticatenaceae bacterium]MCB8989688.1 hypothetical protein [Ardenticatenaceae bacterium]MCB9002853.1 hypothetical protein [Ardenticatenaceae bacterium]